MGGSPQFLAMLEKTFPLELFGQYFATSTFQPKNLQNCEENKQKKLIKLAQTWLLEKKIPQDSFWQIDVASVLIDKGSGKTEIRYFQNAVCESWH